MTCRTEKPRIRQLRFVMLTTACLVLWLAPAVKGQPPQSAKPVTAANAISDTVKSGQTFIGTVMPSRKAVIGSAVDGRVANYYVDEGVRIRAKEPLAQLLTETITSELKTAVRDWQLRIAELQELDPRQRIEFDSELLDNLVDEGLLPPTHGLKSAQTADSPADGTDDPVGKLDKEILVADALRQAAAYSLGKVESDRKRVLDLRKRNIATQEELEEAELEFNLAQAVLDERAATARYTRSTKEFRINQAIERVRMQVAIVEKLIDQKRKHTIITRFDGYVTQEFTEEGAWVNRGDPIAEVAALDVVDVVANVLESQIRYVHIGDMIRIEIPALPDREFTGKVESIVPLADLRTRTIPVKIRVHNDVSGDVPLISAGMLARAMLPTGPEKQGLFVPKDAINLDGDSRAVYVVRQKSPKDDTGKAIPVPVRLGIAHGSLIEVHGDLKEGDLVVVRGNERLKPMEEVQITSRIDSRDLIQTEPVSAETDAATPATKDAGPAPSGQSEK